MSQSPQSPSRKSRRVAAAQNNDPFPFAPLLLDVIPPAKMISGVIFSTYLTFLSRRHLHCYILYLALACLASAYFFRLEIGALSMPALAWFFFLRPKIRVSSEARPSEFFRTTGCSGGFFIDMAAVYVASTGFKDEMGSDIMGLYANQFIKRGYGCFCCGFVLYSSMGLV